MLLKKEVILYLLISNLLGFATCLILVKQTPVKLRLEDSLILTQGHTHLILTPTYLAFMDKGIVRFAISFERETTIFFTDECGNLVKHIDSKILR